MGISEDKMAISEQKMQIVIDNYFKTECDVNTSIRDAFEKGFRIGVKKAPSAHSEKAKRIVGKSKDGMTLWYQCDMCNEPVDEQDAFCSGCGRRLVSE